ncbi:MAG: T9SS C-terminal target domain-containing protein [Calditrichaeota bacterium]|nr:MAG: T9SS C-terminal target domain-containing protein [Calditrichota bacterium]
MFKKIIYFPCFILVIFLVTGSLMAQTINVTFTVNTSTVPDTLGEDGFVQIRGAVNGQTGPILPDGKNITWDSSSELVMQNIGGDYWTITFQMNADDTLRYKFWTGFSADNGTFHPATGGSGSGWEQDVMPTNGLSGGNRAFISGATDTTVQLQYYNGTSQIQEQFWRPFESKPDTIAVYFRVNMGGVTEAGLFDPSVNGPVGVRGAPETSGGVLDWGTTNVVLSREMESVNDGSFWSGVAYIPKADVSVGSKQKYKFFIENKGGIDWEGSVNPDDPDGNRIFTYTQTLVSDSDTTLHWVYFNNAAPTGVQPVQSTVIFRVDMRALEEVGLFDRGVGDRVIVIGPNGWTVGQDDIEMTFVPALQAWVAQEPFTMRPGDVINYKYFIRWDSSRVDPNSPNFIPQIEATGIGDGWEEPALTGGGNRVFEFQNLPQQSPPGDFNQDLQFFDSIPSQGVINTPISVTWNINMQPATDPSINPNVDNIFQPGTDQVFIQFDGSVFAMTQGLPKGGNNSRLELTDPDGDGIYSTTVDLQLPTVYQTSFIVVYIHNGNEITNGGGLERGRRYYQFIHPERVNDDMTITWPSSFEFPVLDWKPNNLDVEEPPDLFTPTAVEERLAGIPKDFELEQNFPNPFNPQTTIRYQLSKPAEVKLAIYNLKGQLVRTLIDKKLSAGKYSIVWDGQDDHGRLVSSGVYFVRMKAGDFTQIRKMALVK